MRGKSYGQRSLVNCVISLGHNECGCGEISIDDFKDYFDDLTEDICEWINDNLSINRAHDNSSNYWFELYDKNNETYNILTYLDIDMLIEFDEPSSYDRAHMPMDVDDWFMENESWSNAITVETAKQQISGFKGVDTSQINVYREGMALKFFGDLVCDYLGEERINEVY